MQLTENFNLVEFISRDGANTPWYILENIKLLACELQVLRNEIQVPITINSAYRTPSHNSNVGGKLNSMHIYGLAVDIATKKYTPRQLHNIIEKLISGGKMAQGGLGLYRSFVHYDIRGEKARWKY